MRSDKYWRIIKYSKVGKYPRLLDRFLSCLYQHINVDKYSSTELSNILDAMYSEYLKFSESNNDK